jgi:hypothetical protein
LTEPVEAMLSVFVAVMDGASGESGAGAAAAFIPITPAAPALSGAGRIAGPFAASASGAT